MAIVDSKQRTRRVIAGAVAIGLILCIGPMGGAAPRPAGRTPTAADPRNGWRPASEHGVAARPASRIVSPDGVPRNDAQPRPVKLSDKRVRELSAARTANSRAYELSDGRVQREISA